MKFARAGVVLASPVRSIGEAMPPLIERLSDFGLEYLH